MQQTNTNQPSPASSSFAGLLAALTAPTPKTAWNNDDLADDVATLSYEHALRNHARYKPAEPADWGFAQAADLAAQTMMDRQAESASSLHAAAARADRGWSEAVAPRSEQGGSTMFAGNLKRASITIRLSKTECEQLHRRAAAAGLTVSAYLRSCTFEAETLRTQVKATLAELRAAAAANEQSKPAVSRRSMIGSRFGSRFEWLSRIFHRGSSGQRLAQA
ncbi:MAG TPA: hypothetical protein VMW15_08450 [Terracidiphilus sp.]|nr:hypothetical protein [Terracidiphilus sp.]HUX28290.1 hypothetical protein [Terracidiphilus sp.]